MNSEINRVSLLFAKTQDQALIAYVIYKAKEVRRSSLGQTSLKIILFFLKTLKVEMAYSFDIYYYGTFCFDILYDAALLVADEVIKDQPGCKNLSVYNVDKNYNKLFIKHKDFLSENKSIIDDIVRIFAPMKAKDIEMISMLHFLYLRDCGLEKPIIESNIINELIELKSCYNYDQVKKWWDIMKGVKLIG